jgi:hypothetical protein
MKELRNERMVGLLNRGLIMAVGMTPPEDGCVKGLFDETLDGGYYDVNYIHDTRVHRKPYVSVAFWVGKAVVGSMADYFLEKEVDLLEDI